MAGKMDDLYAGQEEKPVVLVSLTESQLNAELEKGYRDMNAGRTTPAAKVFDDIYREYGI